MPSLFSSPPKPPKPPVAPERRSAEGAGLASQIARRRGHAATIQNTGGGLGIPGTSLATGAPTLV